MKLQFKIESASSVKRLRQKLKTDQDSDFLLSSLLWESFKADPGPALTSVGTAFISPCDFKRGRPSSQLPEETQTPSFEYPIPNF